MGRTWYFLVFLLAWNSAFWVLGDPELTCANVLCMVGTTCMMINNEPQCVPSSKATCWIWGDPHYRTFDGFNYELQGTCTYTVVKTCGYTAGLPSFHIFAKNENRGNKRVSYVGMVTVELYGHTITMIRSGCHFVRVDGIKTSLPISMYHGMVRISQRGTYIALETNFHVQVLYDCSHQLHVTIASVYRGTVCGLCGNFNGDPSDDFQTPAGTVVSNAIAFGESWSLRRESESCWHDCHGACQPCRPSLAKKYETEFYCGLITTNGSFTPCHSRVNPATFFRSCVHDLCFTGGHQKSLCNNLKAYADACQREGIRIEEWRKQVQCPMECPPNSDYELCGSACPATCMNAEANIPCPDVCMEGCQCKKGFVLSQGKCIPKSSCGCTYEGRPYAINESFWADDVCEKRCVCTATTKEVKCVASSCKASEHCQVVNGVRGCYPRDYGTCRASGGLHYHTFDKHKFDFQGACPYVLTEVCRKPSELAGFSIYVQSEHRGSHIVSINWSVQVNVLGVVLAASRQHPGRILVNGLLTFLPYSTVGGRINAFRRGCHLVIQTDFGLTVILDWENLVTVTLPSTYANTLCGLCGNFNRDPADDVPVPGSILVPSQLIFGNGTELSGSNCSEVIDPQCPGMKALAEQQRASGQDCGLILDKDGPFRECHCHTDEEAFFQDCIYNYCHFQRQQAFICAGIASYATACQATGATIYDWRSSHFCPPSCPSNSHYELCSKDCSQTCSSLYTPTLCLPTCKESCVCNEDFVMSDSQCVPVDLCGCFYQGRYYPIGETFYLDCQESCMCHAGGLVECVASPCGPHEECKVVDGAEKCQKCYPDQNATCYAADNGRYLSFDSLPFDFQGTCAYILAKTHNVKSNVTVFTVTIENQAGKEGKDMGIILVSVEVYGIVLTLGWEKTTGVIKVNGIVHHLPLNLSSGRLRIYQHKKEIMVETSFGLVVNYDLIRQVRVTVPNIYHGKLGGLCGNYNEQTDDEFQLPDGNVVSDVVTFGAAWKIPTPDVSCTDGCSENNCHVYKEKSEIINHRNYCGLLTACDGPFRACYAVVNPSAYLSNCIFDLSWRDLDHQVLCQNIQSYAIACQEVKVSIQPWRNSSFCPIHCPANSHYAMCPDPYNTTCVGIKDHIQYPEFCTEGCQCDDGFSFDGFQCISARECGCIQDERYFHPNESVLLKNCTEKCTCSPVEGFICVAHACPAAEVCKVNGTTMQCYQEDPCEATVCRPKETCQIKNGRPICVPQYIGTCWVWGGLHYRTFDDYHYNLQGNCTYVLVESQGGMHGLLPFSVEEKNENRGSMEAMQQINIHVYGHKITISKGEHGRVRVDDVLYNLPVILADGLVSVSWRINTTIVRTKGGLVVMFHWDWHTQITLPSSYYNNTGGLCGNFNQLADDEWVAPNGTTLPGFSEWVVAWVVRDGSPQCLPQCLGECRTCEGTDLNDNVEQCGVITAPDGPFQSCHSALSPKIFLWNCAYDVCMNTGDHAVLCRAVSSYAHACHYEVQPVQNWRIPIECPLSCPVNSHYEVCGYACPASCSDRTAPSFCTEPCVETCECNEGFILSVDKCVPIESCGCTYKGSYYELGDEFWDGKDCDSHCKCNASQGTVVCHPAHCRDFEECTVVEGVRGCHIIQPTTCTASGDYFYTTFDGQKYRFNGTCLYQLAGVCSDNSTLEPFNVSIQNSPPPDGHVVICSVHDVSITLHAGSWDKIKLNDRMVDLPISLEKKIHVTVHETHVAIVVDTGLSINVFKENLTVVVSVPGIYRGHLCGLCGNGNGNSSDDHTGEYGEKWRVGCSPGCSPDCPPCSLAEQESYTEDRYCGLLLKKFGPFAACQAAIPSKSFFDECIRKTCEVRGQQPTWCDVIASYVSLCQAKNFPLKKWRSNAFCPMACPAHSRYELCRSLCLATCDNPSAPLTCKNALCAEGCTCDAGFILNEDNCVPIRECACEHQGKYYKEGQEFVTEATCRERCQCQENGTVQCRDDVCSGGNYCKVMHSHPICLPSEHSTCYVLGCRHFITFDGVPYSLPAPCSYTLAQSDGPAGFSVVLVARSDGIREVQIQASGYQVTLLRGWRWKAWVNGEFFHLPVTLVDVSVHQEGRVAVLSTVSGLRVYYNLEGWVAVTVLGSYRGLLEGLCGNYNGNKSDEFLMPNGEQAQDTVEFGTSWKVSSENCSNDCGKNCHVCDEGKKQIYRAKDYCGMIQDNKGPFRVCHSLVDPAPSFNHCLLHVCASGGTQDSLCQSLQAYAAACHVAGATIESWRTKNFCCMYTGNVEIPLGNINCCEIMENIGLRDALKCRPRTHYDSCAWTCNSTCATGLSCTRPCFESCSCDNGMLANGAACVAPEKCGCWHNGRLIKQGQSILSPDCKMRYTCQTPGSVISKPHTCDDGDVCGLRNGLRGCFPTVGHCRLMPGLLFCSFDGRCGKIPALGTYELASICDTESENWFRILVRIASCPPNGTVTTTVLYVFIKGAFIIVRGQKEAWVNGLSVHIPYKVSESVTLDRTSQGIILRLPQLEVMLNSKEGAVVTVNIALEGKVCGACGNFNHKRRDDLMGPGGVKLKNVKALLVSWRAREFAHCVG